MKKAAAGDEAQAKTCWATLQKYIGNIAQVTPSRRLPAAAHASAVVAGRLDRTGACLFL